MYEAKPLPRKNEVDKTGESALPENLSAMKPSVAEAVSKLPRLQRRANGIFRHPNDWTEEEINLIVDGLKMNVPIHTLANLVHCERHTLSKLISETPELRQLKEEQAENIYEEAVYQADRLAKAGNASIVMFILERLGKNRGWNQTEVAQDSGTDESRIVMGIIPDEELAAADEYIKAKKAEVMPKSELAAATDPKQLAMLEAAVDEMSDIKAAEKMAAMKEQGRTEEAGAGYSEMIENAEVGGYGRMSGMGEDAGFGDPFSSGADSMYMQ